MASDRGHLPLASALGGESHEISFFNAPRRIVANLMPRSALEGGDGLDRSMVPMEIQIILIAPLCIVFL